MSDTFWQTKLHARLHDPAEKALVLLRDPEGHEGGTSRALHRALGFEDLPVKDWLDPDNADVLDTVLFKKGIPVVMYDHVRRADWWAAAADRPQWPMEEIVITTKTGQTRTKKVADWAQVRWTQNPILIHPLTGKTFDLGNLGDTDIRDIKERSFDHFSRLVVREGADRDRVNWMKTLLAFWRFGPELDESEDNGKLGHLWRLLPADTRVPDHSIWDHLDLTSAFAGAFAGDPAGDVALLTMSIGPVQSFIAAARSTSDLWAGSHLLSRLAWETMRPVCEMLGPDAILFPRLRGLPQVDVWLRNDMGLPAEWFKGCEWARRRTDSNPLFAAALPNRFVAVVPAAKAVEIAHQAVSRVREWFLKTGTMIVDKLLETAELEVANGAYAYRQLREQIDGFPEVHWAAVPFSLIRAQNLEKQTGLDTALLSAAMAPFFGVGEGKACGFLDSPAWKVLQKDAQFSNNTTFFAPNPGVLYPAVFDLTERVLAASKATRTFAQSAQSGWRCSLTGETEWLTADRNQLHMSYRQQTETLWARVAEKKRSWAKQGEHLGAIPAIKRVWPTVFAREVADIVDMAGSEVDRFVVSTHTMALAHQLEGWLEQDSDPGPELQNLLKAAAPVPLPRRLSRNYGSKKSFDWARRIPGLLDEARENGDETELVRIENLIKKELSRGTEAEVPRIESYYALILLDGDNMGRILSEDENAISYRAGFHPQVRQAVDDRSASSPSIKEYTNQKRALSPNRHLAISGALNDFALHIVPEIVEMEHLGRVIYAGGDDVLAMLPVADLLPAMHRLRLAYSGSSQKPVDWTAVRRTEGLSFSNGFAFLNGRLMRMMGELATASCGAVVAHHMAPLGAVLRELREAEKRAKNEGGRDAFSITVIKRSGGDLRFTAKWADALELLLRFRDFLSEPAVSRRAVYNSLTWLKDLPNDADEKVLSTLLLYQVRRQTQGEGALEKHQVASLVERLALWTCSDGDRIGRLRSFLGVAEFLARECRVD